MHHHKPQEGTEDVIDTHRAHSCHTECDVIMLAQFSMACALPAVQQTMARPVLSSPDSAVAALQAQLGAE